MQYSLGELNKNEQPIIHQEPQISLALKGVEKACTNDPTTLSDVCNENGLWPVWLKDFGVSWST